jgi:AraC-like DNA-binding protein
LSLDEKQYSSAGRRGSHLELRSLDVDQDASFTRDGGARRTSSQIVHACLQHATSVSYHGVTLGDLSATSGVSERRVRDAFRECLHVSPTVYLRVAALLEVRDALLEGSCARDAVTRAATDFGFWHLSRFAGQYRALFGEAPSATVTRARAFRSPSGRINDAQAV